jgi:hypothetical protein
MRCGHQAGGRRLAAPRSAGPQRRGLARPARAAARGCGAREIGQPAGKSCCWVHKAQPLRAPSGENHLVQAGLVDGQLGAVPGVNARLADVHHHHLPRNRGSRGAEGPSATAGRVSVPRARAHLDVGAADREAAQRVSDTRTRGAFRSCPGLLPSGLELGSRGAAAGVCRGARQAQALLGGGGSGSSAPGVRRSVQKGPPRRGVQGLSCAVGLARVRTT